MSQAKSKFAGLFGEKQAQGEEQERTAAEAASAAPRTQERKSTRKQGIKKSRSLGNKQERNQEAARDVPRVKTNYEIREDYIRELKLIAAGEGRRIYQVIEEAVEQYLVSRGRR